MNVAVAFNRVPPTLFKGEAADRISEEGAEEEALAVRQALVSLGHAAPLIPLGHDIKAFLETLQTTGTDLVFNLCEGFWGNSRLEGHVAALFDLCGLAFTGSSPLCLGFTQDKARTKDLLVRHGLPTPLSILVNPGEPFPGHPALTYPLIVKPRFEDASLGITEESVVTEAPALGQRIRYIHDTYRQGALVEEFIDGREFNAAVLGNGPMEVLPLSEIQFQSTLKHAIVSYDGKWRENSPAYLGTEPICPAPLPSGEEALVKDVALRAYQLLECRDYARVDIRLRDGIPYILEVNANPDISPGAGLARAAGVAGIGYTKLIERILNLAMNRKELQHAKS